MTGTEWNRGCVRRSSSACTLRARRRAGRPSGGILLLLVLALLLLASSSLPVADRRPVWTFRRLLLPAAKHDRATTISLPTAIVFLVNAALQTCPASRCHAHSIYFDSTRLHTARLPASYPHCSPGRMCAIRSTASTNYCGLLQRLSAVEPSRHATRRAYRSPRYPHQLAVSVRKIAFAVLHLSAHSEKSMAAGVGQLSPPHARRSVLRQSDLVISLSEARSVRGTTISDHSTVKYFIKYVLFSRVLTAAPPVPQSVIGM